MNHGLKIYDNRDELITMLAALRNSPISGSAKVMGETLEARDMVTNMMMLVPDIFKFREILMKNGVGSSKALKKFAEVAHKNLQEDSEEALRLDVEALRLEVEELEEFGVSNEILSALISAKGDVAESKSVIRVVNGFGEKLNNIMRKIIARMERIVKANEDMVLTVRKNSKLLKITPEAIELIKQAHQTLKENHSAIEALVPAMTKYCALNAGLLSIMLGQRKAQSERSLVSDQSED